MEENLKIETEEKNKFTIPNFRIDNTWKKVVAIIGSAFIVILLIGLFSGNDEADWPSTDITKENIKAALEQKPPVDSILSDPDFPGDINKIGIIDNAKKARQKNLLIYYTADAAWDETDYIKMAGSTMIEACSILFQNPRVDTVSMISQTEMTEEYGKLAPETGTKIVLSRATVDKIEWKELLDILITDPETIYRIADNYYIHPSIIKKVKLDEVNLKP